MSLPPFNAPSEEPLPWWLALCVFAAQLGGSALLLYLLMRFIKWAWAE